MAPVVAFCSGCGAIFPSEVVPEIPKVPGLVTRGNFERCLACGGVARAVEGLFSKVNHAALLVAGQLLSDDVLNTFGQLVQRARQEDLSAETLQAEATKLDPNLGKVVSEAQASGLKLGAAILLLALASLKSSRKNSMLDPNQAIDQTISTYSTKVQMDSSETPGVPAVDDAPRLDASDVVIENPSPIPATSSGSTSEKGREILRRLRGLRRSNIP